ncbi:hypothetical protein ABPG72_011154, partial [Tetrahymena utriculariae]
SNNISNAGVSAIVAGLLSCPLITSFKLSLIQNNFGDIGISSIAAGLNNCTLMRSFYFSLNNTNITEEGYQNLDKCLSGLAELISLEFWLCNDENLLKSKDILNCKNIKVLHLKFVSQLNSSQSKPATECTKTGKKQDIKQDQIVAQVQLPLVSENDSILKLSQNILEQKLTIDDLKKFKLVIKPSKTKDNAKEFVKPIINEETNLFNTQNDSSGEQFKQDLQYKKILKEQGQINKNKLKNKPNIKCSIYDMPFHEMKALLNHISNFYKNQQFEEDYLTKEKTMNLNIGKIMIINLALIYQCLAQACQNQQIFNFLSKECVSCSSVCQNCFNISEQSCIGCAQNSYQSYDDVSSCQNQCQKNEAVDSENKKCLKCNISGCVQCTNQQICLACDQFLMLDEKNNQCKVKNDICQSNQQFLIPPFKDIKCTNMCPSSYYQNFSNQICEETQMCPQVQLQSSFVVYSNVNQIGFINQDKYILMSESTSSFAIVDANWKVIAKYVLQENREDDNQSQCFQQGIYGGCLQQYRFNVMNFDTLQVEFDESRLEHIYNIVYLDEINKFVFMKADKIQTLVWYDIKNKKINSIQMDFSNYVLFKILNRYYIQALEVNTLLILDGSKVQISYDQKMCRSQVDMSQISFDLDCYQNLIILTQPCFEVYDQATGRLIQNEFLSQFYGVELSCNPIINIEKQLFAIFSQESQIQINKQKQYQPISYQGISKYGQNLAFYDFDKDIYVILTGFQKVIQIINAFTSNNLFKYETASLFDNRSTYYFQENQSLIVVDNSPIIYLCNCQTRQITIFEMQVYQTNGILMDEQKNTIFLFSDKFIHIYEYPKMTFIESFSLQQYDQTQILNIYLNTQFNLLNVQTQDSFISFDLTEVLYSSEVNLFQYQNFKNIVLNEEYQIYYSQVNYSINLYNQEKLKDHLILVEDQRQIQPYLTELFLKDKLSFIYVLFDYIFIIQVDLSKEKLILISKTQLMQNPSNYFLLIFEKGYNQIMQILYQQNLQLNDFSLLNDEYMTEYFEFIFPDSDFSQALLCGNYLVVPSIKNIFIYNGKIFNRKFVRVDLKQNSEFQFMFKLQSKNKYDYQNYWWKIPFDYEDRYNTNDFTGDLQINHLVCVISQFSQNTVIQILHVNKLSVKYIVLQQTKVTNIVNDPFRKIFYAVLNKGITNIYDQSLKLLSSLQNACLKQAIITYDSNFIYSVCPTGIIIYNGLSFQQQFPVINQGIKEALNIISINYNNYFIIVEKEQIKLVQLKQNSKYQVLFIKKNQFYQVQVLKLLKSQDGQNRLLLILSSQSDIEKIIIPLSTNNKCNLIIQNQDRAQGNFYIQGMIKQTLSNFQNFQIDTTLKVIEISYIDQECIRSLSKQLFNQTETDLKLSLINRSTSQSSNICWQESINFAKEIVDFYITQMTLSINSINLNQESFMQTFQMINVTLNINNSLILQNFKKVYLTNINIKEQENQMAGQLIIKNCELVVIENLDLSDIISQQNTQFNLINNTQVQINTVYISNIKIKQPMDISSNFQSIFITNNNTNITIRNIYVIYSSSQQIFQLNNSQYLEVTGISILQSQNIQFFNVQLIQNSNITNIRIIELKFSIFFNALFSSNTYINSIQVTNSSQLTLINQQNLETNNVSYICQLLQIKDINVINSNSTKFNLQVNSIQIYNLNITQMFIDSHIIEMTANDLYINQVHMNKINLLQKEYSNYIALIVFNIQSFVTQNVQFINNSISFIQVNQQQLYKNKQLIYGQFQIIKSSFFNNQIRMESQLIMLNNLEQIILDQITLKLNNLNQNIDSSFIQISQCYNVTLTKCIFDNNINSQGYGGALYLIDTSKVQIYHSKFISNKCLQKNGGAINFVNKQFLGTLNVNYSSFVINQAIMSTGGAINLSKINLILQNTQIASNIAQIGGGIYYSQIVPDFVLSLQQGFNFNNTIYNNYANIYGRNIGSTLRKIIISKKDIITRSSINIDQNYNTFEVSDIQSGEEIIFQKIQYVDEEGIPIYIPPIQQQHNLSEDVLFIIKQINIQIICDRISPQMQCVGNLSSSDYSNDGFFLAVKPMYKPISIMFIKIQSNTFPKLVDSNSNIYINQGQLDINIQLNFKQCQIGYIQKQLNSSIICEFCTEGTYSLNIFDIQCKKCPETARYCQGSIIQLKDGYWRSNQLSDDIIYCNFNPEVCKPQSQESKK